MKLPVVRERAFAYSCQACGACCTDKRITLSPYELARLAEAIGATTRVVLERHTDEGGTVLRFDAHGCTFKDGARCRAHGGRPLACRLYPLGRIVDEHGDETFVEVAPHPDSKGIYGGPGTIASYLEAQGTEPFVAWAARYSAVARKIFARLDEAEGGAEAFREVVTTPVAIASDWLDVDAVVARAGSARGIPVPADVEARGAIHLEELEAWVASPGSVS